jgi:hypothetical protein
MKSTNFKDLHFKACMESDEEKQLAMIHVVTIGNKITKLS